MMKFPNEWKVMKFMFQSTNQIYVSDIPGNAQNFAENGVSILRCIPGNRSGDLHLFPEIQPLLKKHLGRCFISYFLTKLNYALWQISVVDRLINPFTVAGTHIDSISPKKFGSRMA